MADSLPLTTEQTYALLDILTHKQTYREIEQFKTPGTIHAYGPPFQDNVTPSTPILQSLVSKCALTLPGLREVSQDFWRVQIQTLINTLAEADLSESYDKGNLGIRKTLATAVSSLIEYPARGILGGFPKDESAFKDREYSPTDPDDVLEAWWHFVQRLVYTDYLDILFERAAETDQLSDHDSLTRSAHEFIVVNLASFMHYTLILSPEGSSLIHLIDNVNKLIPYILVRQTLRIGNVATMINAMMKLVLAKVSIGSITNWIGLSSGADEGMNLLQQIISQILGWDKRDFKKRLEKIDRDKDGPSQEVKATLKDWARNKDREEHLSTREMSKQNKMSMVQTILALSSTDPEMSEAQHAKALEYLALNLSIHDRSQLIRVLCHSSPDHLTQCIKEGVAAYEPSIRQLHKAVDLSDTISDCQNFVHDMLKLCKPRKSDTGEETSTASVEDFVDLLHNHQQSLHKFLHQVAKNGPNLAEPYRQWCHATAARFRQAESGSAEKSLFNELASFVSDLPIDEQSAVKEELDSYSAYLSGIYDDSAARVREVVREIASREQDKNSSSSSTPSQSQDGSIHLPSKNTNYGPGAYLAKWQDLLNTTEIQPNEPFGPLRSGADISLGVDGGKAFDDGSDAHHAEETQKLSEVARPPQMDRTLKLLGPRFDAALKGEA